MMNQPSAELEWVLTLRVDIGPGQLLGDSLAGHRSNYPIVGGDFSGQGELKGQVLAGGDDFFVLRRDGVGQLDARYSLRSDRGELINVRNRGLLTLSEHGQQLERAGQWPLPEHEYRCSCSPAFEVPNGRLDWLIRSHFIGRVHYPTASRVVIDCYRLA
ncbi:DUF3237 domain-containing protein [Pseudomonas cedrina subsp. fulgida]|nr:DUF3237 domain-containing protein [Pseudomonas cedrina subsp. fulgida]